MIDEQIRRVLADNGRMPVDVATLADDADLYRAGLSSRACVSVMLALEEVFDVEFPEDMLRKATFGSVAAVRVAITELLSEGREG
jgi:acyl carrier protein